MRLHFLNTGFIKFITDGTFVGLSDEELVEAAFSGIVGSEEERAMLRDDAPPVAQTVLPPVERGEP